MRGHEPLIEMRRNGFLPGEAAFVSDNDFALDHWFSRNWHGYSPRGELTPCIAIDENDVIEVIDFRFLTGLIVHLHAGRGDDRAKRLFASIRAVQPKVLACCRPQELWIFSRQEGGNGKRIRS